MVVPNKNYEVNGNAALLPKRKTYEKDSKLNELKKAKEEHLKNKKQLQNKTRAKVMLSIFSIFVVGILLVFRYSTIYNMEKQLIETQSEANNLSKMNDSLRFQLAQYNNINYVEQKAAAMHMVEPDKKTAVYVNLNKQNIVSDKNSEANNKSMSFFEFIKSKLFL